MCILYFVAAVALCVCVCVCVCVRGAGANLNSVKTIVTLHWNQPNLIQQLHVKIGSIQINLKIPCTSCSD